MQDIEHNQRAIPLLHIPAAEVLYAMHMQKETAVLSVRQEDTLIRLTFQKGEILDLWSNFIPGLSLGEYLVKKGRITEVDRQAAFYLTAQQNLQMGVVLLQQKKVSPHLLFEGIQSLALEKIELLSSWRSATYHLEHIEAVPPNLAILSISMSRVLFSGLKKSRELEQLQREFDKRLNAHIQQKSSHKFAIDMLGLSREERQIWISLQTPRTLSQIVDVTKVPMDASMPVLFAWLCMDLATFQHHEGRGTIEFFDIVTPYIIDELEAASAFYKASDLLPTEEDFVPPSSIDDFQLLKQTLDEILSDDSYFEGWTRTPKEPDHKNPPEVINLKDEQAMIQEIQSRDFQDLEQTQPAPKFRK